MTMELIPEEAGRAALGWDEQSLDLRAAAGQVEGAGSGGFTAAVQGVASSFITDWHAHVTALAASSEAQADGLRRTISDWIDTDEGRSSLFLLLPYTVESR